MIVLRFIFITMELNINLLSKNQSLFKIILGIIFVVFAILQIVTKDKSFLNWFTFLFFILYGMVKILEGFSFFGGNSFGKAFVLINENIISFKISIFKKEQKISWNKITSIDYDKVERLYIISKNQNKLINLSQVSYEAKQEIKNTLNYIAKQKNIPSSIQI